MVDVAGCEQSVHHQVIQPQIRPAQVQPPPPQRTYVQPCIMHSSAPETQDLRENSQEPANKLAENCEEGK